MELVGKTHLARSAKEAAAFLDKAFHGNAAWHALVRLEKWPRTLPQICYRVHDREVPAPAVFEIAFMPISPAQCIMHIIGLIDGAALSRAGVLYLGYMRCEAFCGEVQSLIAAKHAPAPAVAVLTSTDAEIRGLCVAWAARGILTSKLPEFLKEHHNSGGRYFTVDVFKAMLRDGGKRRWIKKVKNRWRPAS